MIIAASGMLQVLLGFLSQRRNGLGAPRLMTGRAGTLVLGEIIFLRGCCELARSCRQDCCKLVEGGACSSLYVAL